MQTLRDLKHIQSAITKQFIMDDGRGRLYASKQYEGSPILPYIIFCGIAESRGHTIESVIYFLHITKAEHRDKIDRYAYYMSKISIGDVKEDDVKRFRRKRNMVERWLKHHPLGTIYGDIR